MKRKLRKTEAEFRKRMERKVEEKRELAHKRKLELQKKEERKMEKQRELAHKRELELQMEEETKMEEERRPEMEPVRQRVEEVQKEPFMKDEEREEQVEMDMERKKQEEEKQRKKRVKETKNMEQLRQREKDLPKKLVAQNVAPGRGSRRRNTDWKQEARGGQDQGSSSGPKKAEVITLTPLVASDPSSTSTFKQLESSRPTSQPLVIKVKPLALSLDTEEDGYDQFSPNAPSPLPAPSEGPGTENEASPEQNLQPEEEAPAPEKSCEDVGAKKKKPKFPNVKGRVSQWVSKKMRERYQKEIQEVRAIEEEHRDVYCFASPSDTLQGKVVLMVDFYREKRERLEKKEAQWQPREAYWREKGKK